MIPLICLITTVRWLSLLKLTVSSQSAIVVLSAFRLRFVLSLSFFEFSVGVRAFVLGLSQIISFFSNDRTIIVWNVVPML